MSLLKDLYHITSLQKRDEGSYTAEVMLDGEHDIFKGHFPGNPVLPGVCLLQIIKEVTEQVAGVSLFLESSSNIKFTAKINPEEDPNITLDTRLEQDGDRLKLRNTTRFGDTPALKLSAVFRVDGESRVKQNETC